MTGLHNGEVITAAPMDKAAVKTIKGSTHSKAKLAAAIKERTMELELAIKELDFQLEEKEKRAGELLIANKELAFQNSEKEKRAAELIVANIELVFQNGEKEKRAQELITLNKELESFTYISSHDLQEPLRKIQTFASLILQQEYSALSDNAKEHFNKMHKAAKRMQALIKDLLAYSHTSISDRTFEKTDLNNIIIEVTEDLSNSILDRKAVIDISGSLPEVFINPSQFRQVINNLVSNALKFSHKDVPPHITIQCQFGEGSQLQNSNAGLKAHSLMPEKKYYHLSVADNGIGFDPQFKEKIFIIFQRLHSVDEYAGTGIGLAIVKKIVENHQGVVSATGVLGKGARFDIYIPDLVP